MQRVKIDYERFVKTDNAYWLYQQFQKDLLSQKEATGIVQMSDLMPPKQNGRQEEASDFRYFFYMAVLYSFESAEKQVYRIGKNLAHMFLDTKLPKLSLDDVKPPFPCFYITVPEELGLESQGKRVHGCYVFDSRDESNLINMTIQENVNDTPRPVQEIYFVLTYHSAEKPDDCGSDTISVLILSPGESDLEKYVEDAKRRTDDPDQNKISEAVVRLALNLVFYLNSSEREIGVVERPDVSRIRELEKRLKEIRPSRTKLIQKAQQKLNAEKNKVVVTVLAPTIEKQEPYESEKLTKVHAVGHKKRRHPVSGFYNYYWCSDRDENGKRIPGKKHVESRWIKPHSRGSEIGEIIRKEYSVVDPEPS